MEALHVLNHTISNTGVILAFLALGLVMLIARITAEIQEKQRRTPRRTSSVRRTRRQYIDITWIEEPYDSKADTKEFMTAQDEETGRYIAGTLTIDLPKTD